MSWSGDNLGKDIREYVAKEIRVTAFRVLRGVTFRTPVDTGRLKSNWQLDVATPPNGTINSVTDTTPKGSFNLSLINAAIGKISKTDPPQVVYIVNNLPYAKRIEDGHGGRNPGVMVEATLRSIR